MINVGLIGYGYWGPNLARNLAKIPGCRLAALADQNPERLGAAKALYPWLETTESAAEILQAPAIDAVVIATPISTHFPLAMQALDSGKHVLVEKPMTTTVAEAEGLIAQAERKGKTLMVDHTFLFSGAVRKLREIIDSGQLGEIYYYDSVRVNLGLLQPDVNVLWDLAPHDFSIMCYLIDKQPATVAAIGTCPVRWDGWHEESVAYITVEFEGGTIAHFHVNWLSPVKLRRTLIGGSRRMVIYDHLDQDHQIKIYDKGIEVRSAQDRYKALVQYRTGDLLAPKVDQTEALDLLCRHFIDCVQTGKKPLTDGRAGLRVVELLEAAQHSVRSRGKDFRIWLQNYQSRRRGVSVAMSGWGGT